MLEDKNVKTMISESFDTISTLKFNNLRLEKDSCSSALELYSQIIITTCRLRLRCINKKILTAFLKPKAKLGKDRKALTLVGTRTRFLIMSRPWMISLGNFFQIRFLTAFKKERLSPWRLSYNSTRLRLS